jgi:hypothetical protein
MITRTEWLGLLQSVSSAAIGAVVGLLIVWLNSRESRERQRKDQDHNADTQLKELRLKQLEALVEPRINGHLAISEALEDLGVMIAHSIGQPEALDSAEFNAVRSGYEQSLRHHHLWVLGPALDILYEIHKRCTGINSASDLKPVLSLIGEARVRLRWSLGLENLESFTKEIWSWRPAGS